MSQGSGNDTYTDCQASRGYIGTWGSLPLLVNARQECRREVIAKDDVELNR